ncbi:hypothetical protein QWM81_07150 [Streptomyces ficellus]|uniref:Uncharacterized protein n=1 Tax=Streptomyces ficellus TaxID=1977088 RepID=A0ABT7Z2Z9_9ACTN|nr:hypothetical protein [Streptomyces ficellus]MDN3293821.1 hypothetical protein [Streptomyces ficellus]
MADVLARLFKPLWRSFFTGRREEHPAGPPRYPYPYPYPYSCDYVGGPTTYRTGERPPWGDDSPLVRPYLIAHERRVAAEARPRTLWIAGHGVDVGPHLVRGVEVDV